MLRHDGILRITVPMPEVTAPAPKQGHGADKVNSWRAKAIADQDVSSFLARERSMLSNHVEFEQRSIDVLYLLHGAVIAVRGCCGLICSS